MDHVDLKLLNSPEHTRSRLEIVRSLIIDPNGDMSLDFLLDIFQNLILDCKFLDQCNSNKYLNNVYKIYESINAKLFNLRIKSDDFNMLKIIGEGAFGQVQLVRHRESGQLYALKILNKSHMKEQEGSVFWRIERDIMSKIDSRWIVKLHYAFQDARRLYMAMEYLPGGNLLNWLMSIDDILEADVCFYMAEIVLAINTIHQHNFVHRDIKPDNVLFDIRGHIKLADFGSCVKIDDVSKLVECNRAVGTPDYISPEVLTSQSNNTKYGREVDWWAFGVVLYEILYGNPPFCSETLVGTYGKIMAYKQCLTFPPEEQISEFAISLMKSLICDRSVRLGVDETAKDIKMHRFFTGENYQWSWDNIHCFDAPCIPKLQSDSDTSYFDSNMDEINNDILSDENAKELGSKSFGGENLQFSGFSYSNMFKDLTSHELKTDSTISRNVKDQRFSERTTENASLTNKILNLSKESQDLKNDLEKLLIEKKDIETQLQMAIAKYKNEEGVSKKLQIDHSELLSKHGMCQQRFSKMEEEKHKLCTDMANTQSNATDETRRLLSQIEKQQDEYKALNAELSETQAEYRKYKLQNIKLENEAKYFQKRYDNLEQELNQSKLSNSTVIITTAQNISLERISSELRELRADYDEKCEQLELKILENQSLLKSVAILQKEKEIFKLSLAKSEDLLTKEISLVKKMKSAILEKDVSIDDMKVTNEQYRKRLVLVEALEKELRDKLKASMSSKSDEKLRHINEFETEKKKLQLIISNKTDKILQLEERDKSLSNENLRLKDELEMVKIKSSALVVKIDQIIKGKSTVVGEMMITEDMKSGKLDKRSGRQHIETLKQKNTLQSMLDQLTKDSMKKEKEFKEQIENLKREKENLENENSMMNTTIESYKNVNQNSFQVRSDSGYAADALKLTSTPNRYRPSYIKNPLTNVSPGGDSSTLMGPPKLPIKSYNEDKDKSELRLRQSKMKVVDPRRFSMSGSFSSEVTCLDGQLDVSVKVKGKKMSWEKRFVKIDSHSLLFYDQSLRNILLKLPLLSIVFVRGITNADAIHAKKAEIPQIFQICFDKNQKLYSDVMKRKSRSESDSSVNTLISETSDLDSTINDVVESRTRDSDTIQRSRRNSMAKTMHLFRLKSKPKATSVDMTIDSNSIFIKGHIFNICDKPLTAASTPSVKDLKAIVPAMPSAKDADSIGTVDCTKAYKCYHCATSLPGSDISDRMLVCNESLSVQLCRVSSNQLLCEWISSLNSLIKCQRDSLSMDYKRNSLVADSGILDS